LAGGRDLAKASAPAYTPAACQPPGAEEEEMPSLHVQPWLTTATPFAGLVAGALLLFFGRRLFWLFVAVVGFMAGWYFAASLWHNHSSAESQMLLALVGGLIGLVLALVVQKLAVAIAGFFVGFQVVASLLGWHPAALHATQLLVLVAAGVVAAILALMLFDFALILLSAVAGAGLIVDNVHLHLSADARLLALVLLAVVGAAVQAHLLRRYPMRRRV
jgi:hypothetical protein